ncbi:hypothetical protein GHT09_017622 [Marmota monax]|uniref:C3H1-type domain-containing protein n=1 Tax=Marmota monax TaxID=9995 RepID=A0A834Q4N4_MARMO|nr:hypothetical protein GHT09_017622 [Marmota monax]
MSWPSNFPGLSCWLAGQKHCRDTLPSAQETCPPVTALVSRSTPCPSVKHGDEWGEPSRCNGGDSCQYCHSRTEQQFHPEIYKSTKCNDMRQTGYCPRGPFCAFAHVDKTLGTASGWGCRDLNSTHSTLAHSGQPGNPKRRDLLTEGSQKAGEPDSKQNHLAVFAVVHPLAPSVSSSVASSLASSAGSGSSSPTAVPALPARALPPDPAGSTVEAVLGKCRPSLFSPGPSPSTLSTGHGASL